MHHVTRGYCGLQDNDHIVHVTSDKDFVLHIWARNVETAHGGIQIITPPSQFRGVDSMGSDDGLVLDVPPETGMDLGCIGARAGETIDITSAFSARVTIYLTVVTSVLSNVTMTRA
jgi:hypothetical protein